MKQGMGKMYVFFCFCVHEFIVCVRYRDKTSPLVGQQGCRPNQLHCVADDEYKELGLVMYVLGR